MAAMSVAATAQGIRSMAGKPVPPFSIKDIGGATHTNKTLMGKVVLYDFWATWCVPCRKASPTMQKLHAAYSKRGLLVIGANAYENTNGKPSGKVPAARYAAEHKYTYKFAYDTDRLAKSLGVRGLPVFVLADRRGVIQRVWVSFDAAKTPAELEAAIGRALGAR